MDEIGPRVSERDVAAFERVLGHSLPADYRRFLLDVNGGGTTSERCEFAWGVVNAIFSLNDPVDASNLAERARRAPEMPSKDLLFSGRMTAVVGFSSCSRQTEEERSGSRIEMNLDPKMRTRESNGSSAAT